MRSTIVNGILMTGLLLVCGCESEPQAQEQVESHLAIAAELDSGHDADTGARTTKSTAEPEINSALEPTPLTGLDQPGWTTYRNGPESTGVATTELPEQLEVIWKYEIDKGYIEGSPIIVGGHQPRVYIGGEGEKTKGQLLALDLATGELIWKFDTESGFVTAPAFLDGRIYIGEMEGAFHCIDESGASVWQFSPEGAIDSSANFFEDLVLFGSRDTRLYALDRKSGDVAWNLETEDEVRCGITVVEGRAFVAGCDGALHIVDVASGKEIGSVPINSPTGVTPAATGDVVYVGTEQAGLYAIDWKQAEENWNFTDEEGYIQTRSSPAVSGGNVVFGARDRNVYSIDTVTGEENWRTELKAGIDSSAIIVGQRVFVGSTDGRLYALNLENGEIVWQAEFEGGFLASPAAAFGRLVVATDRGVIYCLGGRGGPLP